MNERGPFQVMLSVWKALFLREAIFRLFSSRTAWVWLLLEPLAHFAFLSFLFVVIRQRSVGNMDIVIWLVLGLTGFFLFRRAATQAGGAIDSNRALFTYRQVLPFDAIVVRAFLEGVIMLATFGVILVILKLIGFSIMPDRPLLLFSAFFGLWFLGLALGILAAVLNEVASESRNILAIVLRPLYFVSGVIFPASRIPVQYRDYFMINPVFHGVEATRSGFSDFYHAVPELNLAYLYQFALVTFALSLLLYRRLNRLIMER